jgi:hypothetical protein
MAHSHLVKYLDLELVYFNLLSPFLRLLKLGSEQFGTIADHTSPSLGQDSTGYNDLQFIIPLLWRTASEILAPLKSNCGTQSELLIFGSVRLQF